MPRLFNLSFITPDLYSYIPIYMHRKNSVKTEQPRINTDPLISSNSNSSPNDFFRITGSQHIQTHLTPRVTQFPHWDQEGFFFVFKLFFQQLKKNARAKAMNKKKINWAWNDKKKQFETLIKESNKYQKGYLHDSASA